ncbi:MAG: biotin transporter BioY [Alphaproteobacteria bacterium]
MAQSTTYFPTLLDTVWDSSRSSRWMRSLLITLGGSLLLTVAAKIQVPFYPVPMTMTTFVVLFLGMACGWRLGGAIVLFYLIQGAAGLPVFAGTPEKGIGVAYMMGPTGGYLIGYYIAAVAVGFLAERGWDRNIVTTAAAMLIGSALIYVPGLLYLGGLFGWDKPIMEWGLYPFVLGDLSKVVLAAVAMPLLWKVVKR